MAGAIDATLRKFHASLNVSDLERSIAFYRALLGAEPAKVRSDYAKFDLADPPLVLSLIPKRSGAGGPLNHAGLRMRNAEELVEVQRRLEAAGMPTSARRASSAVTRARPSSGSPIRMARSGRSTSFTKTSTTMARRRRLALKKRRSRRHRRGRSAPGSIIFATRFRPASPTTTTHSRRCASKVPSMSHRRRRIAACCSPRR